MNFANLDHESFYHAAMATIPSSILILDERLTVRKVNRNFLEKSQGTLESTLGRRLPEIFPPAFQDTALDQQIRDVISTGATLHRQRMNYRAPGVSLRTYSYSICPMQLHDKTRGAILVMDDVTDLLRLSEEMRRMQLHLGSVVESAGDLIISTDPAGLIMTWNRAAELATGYSAAEMCGHPFAARIEAPQDGDAAACFLDIARLGDRRSVEWPMRCRDGGGIPVSWHLSCMTATSGQVTGVVVVGRNLVEQRAMEAQVHQAEKLAALGMVIGGIAHEIRNPLGVSSAAAQLITRSLGSTDLVEECVAKVISGIDRASVVVESLLRFARPGPIRDAAPVDMVAVLNNALMFASGEAAAGTRVEWKPPAQPVYAKGVQNLLELVIINLSLNAFQAMPQGGVLSIDMAVDSSEVAIEIGDTGPGIPEGHRSKIFDPFFTTRHDNRRAGLGLSVSHSIVQQHGGSLSLRSSSLSGTRFAVRLPLDRPPEGAGPAPASLR